METVLSEGGQRHQCCPSWASPKVEPVRQELLWERPQEGEQEPGREDGGDGQPEKEQVLLRAAGAQASPALSQEPCSRQKRNGGERKADSLGQKWAGGRQWPAVLMAVLRKQVGWGVWLRTGQASAPYPTCTQAPLTNTAVPVSTRAPPTAS